MAAVAPPADDAANLLTTLSLDSQTKSLKASNPVKKFQPSVDSGNNHKPSNKAVTAPDFMDPTLAYYPSTAYYYGGYEGTANDWDDLAYGVYGYGFGYAPYGTYSSAGSPVPTVAQDGQLFGAQHYQYPNAYFQLPTPTGGPYVATVPPLKNETKPAIIDQVTLASDATKGSVGNGVGSKGNTGIAPVKSTPYQNSSSKANGSYGIGAQNGYDGVYSSMPWLNGIMSSDPQTRNDSVASRTQNHLMGPNSVSGMYASAGSMSSMYPNKLYGQYGNSYRSGYGYGYGVNAYDFQNNGRGWSTVDNKFKPRVRANGFFGYNNDNNDGLNELNRGPRSRITKNQKALTPLPIAVKAQSASLSSSDSIENDLNEVKEVIVTPDIEQYNKTEFPETYADAKFFIIKSYSEDDVHKSIKYNVWASTQNGNKKLDSAYREAQQKSEGCPVFLFFSVNTSGQFVGVAEMVGAVDFNKSLEYWQQDKWIGCFPVKWHIVKDIPNSLLKHIILEYNENKPVSNSRDTQEVKLVQGLQMIKIFKEHSSKQCILDDFGFYEDRQKKIQQKKAKQQFQKQSWQGKFVTDKKIEGGENEVLKSDNGSALVNEVKLTNNLQDVAAKREEEVVVNGVANAC